MKVSKERSQFYKDYVGNKMTNEMFGITGWRDPIVANQITFVFNCWLLNILRLRHPSELEGGDSRSD